MSLRCKAQSDGSKCLIVKRIRGCAPEVSPERDQFLQILRMVPGLAQGDQIKYATLFVHEKIRGLDQLAKFDVPALKAIGIPLGDAMEIVEAMGKYSTSRLIQERTASSTFSLSSSSLTSDTEETLTVVPALPADFTYYAFASHNWGSPESGFLNHTRTTKLVDRMKSLDIPFWFDHDRMSGGNIDRQITEGIDQSAVFIAFITRDYVEKVLSGSDSDKTEWCHFEFTYGGLQRPNKMVAVVMEPEMLDTRKWKGVVGARLGAKLFVDFSSDDKLESSVVELCRALSNLI